MEILKTQEMNDNTFLEEQEEDVIREQEEDQAEESSREDDIQVIIKDVEEIKVDEEKEKVEKTFLDEKDLSENLVETLIHTDLTDQHDSDDDTDNLQDLWQAKIEVDKSSDSINSTSGKSSFNHIQLSSNSIYLKKVLSKPLIQALREIVTKKPADPVEYLSHWLLHYKICEERTLDKQKERESELLIHVEKLELEIQKKKVEKEVDLFIERKDEEEYNEDQNYNVDYEIDYEIMT